MVHVTGQFYHSLSRTVSANTKLAADGGSGPQTESITIPKDVQLTELVIGWPASDGGVGVRVETKSGSGIFPRNSGDDYESVPTSFNDTFPLRDTAGDGIPLEKDDVLVAKYINYDTTNDKFATVMAALQDEVPEEER